MAEGSRSRTRAEMPISIVLGEVHKYCTPGIYPHRGYGCCWQPADASGLLAARRAGKYTLPAQPRGTAPYRVRSSSRDRGRPVRRSTSARSCVRALARLFAMRSSREMTGTSMPSMRMVDRRARPPERSLHRCVSQYRFAAGRRRFEKLFLQRRNPRLTRSRAELQSVPEP
jgi:hypothetical protein